MTGEGPWYQEREKRIFRRHSHAPTHVGWWALQSLSQAPIALQSFVTTASREGRWCRFTTYHILSTMLSVSTNVVTFGPDDLAKAGIFVLILQIRTLRHAEMKWLAHRHHRPKAEAGTRVWRPGPSISALSSLKAGSESLFLKPNKALIILVHWVWTLSLKPLQNVLCNSSVEIVFTTFPEENHSLI